MSGKASSGGGAAAVGADDASTDVVKIICLGDSMVGKSKLVERFLMDDYEPQVDSTYVCCAECPSSSRLLRMLPSLVLCGHAPLSIDRPL